MFDRRPFSVCRKYDAISDVCGMPGTSHVVSQLILCNTHFTDVETKAQRGIFPRSLSFGFAFRLGVQSEFYLTPKPTIFPVFQITSKT